MRRNLLKLGRMGGRFGMMTAVAGVVSFMTVSLPTDFLSRWTPDFQILWSSQGGYSTNIDYAAYKPAIAKTYRVKAGGSDAAAGGVGTELLSLSVALAKSDVDEVVIDCSAGDYIMRAGRGWNGTQPARDVSIRVIGPGRAISVFTGSSSLPTWVNTAGAVYKTTITATFARSVIDLKNKESDGFYQRLSEVGSTGAVASTPGSWFHDGTDLHVQAYDSRNLVGDTLMHACANGNNMRMPSANRVIWVDGIDFVGGTPFVYTATATFDPLLVALNCTFQGSSNQNFNGINITGPGRFYFYRCGAGHNYRDQFNYHGNGFGDPKFFENECYTGFGGFVQTSDNASTSHENAAGVRLNGYYVGSLNRPVADINDTRICMFGGTIGQARTVAAANENLAPQNTNKTWVAAVSLLSGSNPVLVIAGTASLFYRDMPTPTRAGTAEDTGTLAVWA